jgi:hypothetical protein
MSVDQHAARKPTHGDPEAELRKQVEKWFADHGVPQFADRYVPEDRLRFLVLPLAVLVAFEIGAAPKLESLPALLIIPPVVVALMAWTRPFVWWLLGHDRDETLSWRRLAGLLTVLLALGAGVARLSDWPPLWSDAWVDFGIILSAEFASMAVFTRYVWIETDEKVARLRRRLVRYTVGAVLFFALLLTLDQGAAIDSQRLLDSLVPGDHSVPLAAPVLGCMLFIFGLANRVSLATRDARERRAEAAASHAVEEPASLAAVGGAGTASSWVAACYPALPLLVLMFAAQTTALREAERLGWARAWLPLMVTVGLFALSAAAWGISSTTWWTSCSSTTRRWRSRLASRWRPSLRRERRAGGPLLGRAAWDRMFEGAGNPLFVAPLLAACLFGYPAKAGASIGIELFGWDIPLGTAAVLMFAVYVVLVFVFVWFGLDQVGVWVWQEIRNDVMQIVQGVAGGLPMLLVFAAFFALTAETWEIVVETDTSKFLLLVGLLVALTIGVLVLLAGQQLGHAQRQLTAPDPPDAEDEPGNGRPSTAWEWLHKRAVREGGPSRDEPTTAAIRELFRATNPPPVYEELSPALKPRMRVNALLVIAAYQALVLVPVGLSALLLFWGVGRLAVSPGVAAEWIYGDNAGEAEERLVDNLSFLGEPWTRVPLVLAAFSVLYLTVTLLTNKEQRTYFFSAASKALQQRLAVRVAYRLHFGDPAPAPATEEAAEPIAAGSRPGPGDQVVYGR